MNPLAEACAGSPFSNGTEGDAWMSKWCEFCVHDHDMHLGNGPGCSLIFGAMLDEPWPEAWLPEPDDGDFYLPSRMICGQFEPCHEGGCTGDPAPEERAERVAEVTVYWRDRAETSEGRADV